MSAQESQEKQDATEAALRLVRELRADASNLARRVAALERAAAVRRGRPRSR